MDHSIPRLRKIMHQAMIVKGRDSARDASLIRLAIAAAFDQSASGMFRDEINRMNSQH